MSRRQRLLTVLAVLMLLAVGRIGQELYVWYASAEDRADFVRLEGDLEEAAFGVIRTQLRADTIRAEIRIRDDDLGISRAELDRFEREIAVGAVSEGFARGYRGDLRAYNRRVTERNELFAEWRLAVDRNQEHVQRYNALADSIRAIAARMGEPYYAVPSPAELVTRRGMVR